MKKVVINTEYITLGQFLKIENFISSGGEAKFYLASNKVLVNNEFENRRGRKLYKDMIVEIENQKFIIDNAK